MYILFERIHIVHQKYAIKFAACIAYGRKIITKDTKLFACKDLTTPQCLLRRYNSAVSNHRKCDRVSGSTLRFLINVPGRLLIFRLLPDPPDLIRTPRLLSFKYLTDEVALFFFNFYKLFVFVCSDQRYN